MKPCTSGLIIFLLIIIWEPGLTYGRMSNKERDALKALYYKTGGRNWFHKENWKKAKGTEPTWYGISCDPGNTTVLKIELHGNNLQGVLPADIDAFSNLTTLDLSHNQLTGEIPRWLEKLNNLKKLDLSNNNFAGPIPSWIGSLKNLEELLLDNNRLDGPIPGELAKLTNLKVLRLGGNHLTGEIPAELVKLVNLEDNQSNFKWNGLYTEDVDLKYFLKQKQLDVDWESSQTIVPTDVKVVRVTENMITIDWQPIPYTADNGGYEVFYSEEGHPYDDKSVEVVTDKTFKGVSLKELKKSTKYHFKIRTWTDSHGMNTNRIESPFSKEFTAATRGIIISGTIKNQKDGKGFPGVRLTASNGDGTTYTDKDGKYKLSVIPGWTGTVTPFKEGIKFSPPEREYLHVESDISGNDYTAESYTVISGKVTYNGKGVGDVILKFTGENGDNYTALADDNGNYEKEVSYKWSGSVTPIKDRHQFKPKEKKYTKVTSRHEGQNYEVQLPKIFGKVKIFRGKGISRIKLKFSNIETEKFKYLKDYAITDEKGNYENDVLKNWAGSVTPESSQKYKYFFYPPSGKINNFEDAKRSLNFKAWRNFKFFFSITVNSILFRDFNSYYYDIFPEKITYPGITLGFKFFHSKSTDSSVDMYIWCGSDFIFKRLNSKVLGEPTVWIKQKFSLGICIEDILIKPFLEVILEAGLVLLRYKEGNFDYKVPANSFGVFMGSGFIFNINDRWFTGIKIELMNLKRFNISKLGFSLGYRF